MIERAEKSSVTVDDKRITLIVRPVSDQAKRAAVLHAWHKSLLHDFIPQPIQKWEPALEVKVEAYFFQRMKTRWGSCNQKAGHIHLNTELVKKPRDLIDYVVVHEMLHRLEPTHNARSLALLSEHYPAWRAARAELNELPRLAAVGKE